MAEKTIQTEINNTRGVKIATSIALGALAVLIGGVTYPEWGPHVAQVVQTASTDIGNFADAVAHIGPNTVYAVQQFGEILADNARQLELLAAAGLVAIGGAASGYIGKKES